MITRAEIKQINSEFLSRDDSHLWPINGKFNATKRAINKVRKLMRDGLTIDSAADYEATLELVISNIVNKEV